MSIPWRGLVTVFLTAPGLLAQAGAPQFTLPQRFLEPGDALEIYGSNLAPEPYCGTQLPVAAPFPEEVCGVRVTVGGIPAGLRYVSAKQVNVDLPAHLADAPAAIEICVRGRCSQPVQKFFSTHTAFLRAQGTWYVGMPLWLAVDAPRRFLVSYPCSADPWDFNGPADDIRLEVRRDGQLLAPLARPNAAGPRLTPFDCVSGFAAGSARLPLHLAYRLESPGTYEVRLTGTRDRKMEVQSAWSQVEVEPWSPVERDRWLRGMEERIPSARPADLMGDIVPSLLASPDEQILRLLAPVYATWLNRPLANRDIFVGAFLHSTLAAFDRDLIARVLPAEGR